MVDPFSIATGCAGLVFSVAGTIRKISMFVSEVRNARKDMDQVACQLMSLQLCLESLSGDGHNLAIELPSEIRLQIKQILLACEANIKQIDEILLKVQSGRLGRRIQWTLSEREDIERIRSALESHKTALEIGLSVCTISLLTKSVSTTNDYGNSLAVVVQQTESISANTASIEQKIDNLTVLQQDTSRFDIMNIELIALRKELGNLSATVTKNSSMKILVDQTRIYVSNMIEPLAVPLSSASETDVASLMRLEPISRTDSNANPLSNNPSDSQPILPTKACPTCTGLVTSQQQNDAINSFNDQQSAYDAYRQQDIEQALDHVQRLQKDMQDLQQAKSNVEQEMTVRIQKATQESSAALSAKDSMISKLLRDLLLSSLDRHRKGEAGKWLISAEEQRISDDTFTIIDRERTGLVSHQQVLHFFSTRSSSCTEPNLKYICLIADIDSDGFLSRSEFAVAMYLIKNLPEVPDVLPAGLIPPEMREKQLLDQSAATILFTSLELSLRSSQDELRTEKKKRKQLEQQLRAIGSGTTPASRPLQIRPAPAIGDHRRAPISE